MPSLDPNKNASNSTLRSVAMVGLLMFSAAVLSAQTVASGAGVVPGLGSLPNLTPGAESRMISPENPTGEKGKAAMAIPNPSNPFPTPAAHLGQGWKVRPFINVPAHSAVTIMDIAGSGTIEHIWMASSPNFEGNGRATVLRFYWDGEQTPLVEVPLTDFFAIGNDRFTPVNSVAVVDVPTASMNCYWPMPFRKHARFTVTNDSDKILPLFTYQIDYRLSSVVADAAYFHAQWRRATVNPSNPAYTILDGAKGEGRYVGHSWLGHKCPRAGLAKERSSFTLMAIKHFLP